MSLSRLTGCAAAIMLGATACPPVRAASTDPASASERAFAIARQPLAGAILMFSEQAGVELLVATDVTAGIAANEVRGRMSIPAAFDRLLHATGLRWRYLGPGVVTIERGRVAAIPTVSVMAPVVIEADAQSRRLWANGSSDPTATEDTGALAVAAVGVGTKTPVAPLELPRSTSALTADRLAQQGLVSSNEALVNMPGVTAQLVDGISGYALFSRGFPLTTLSFDGGGPLFYQFAADADARTLIDTPELAQFDHVEVLRGSAGQFGGLAAVSGVVNFQRKRPLDHRRLALTVQQGSWDNRRIEVDASLPIAFENGLRARLVGVTQNRDFHYDVTHEDRAFLYGTLEGEIGPSLSVRVGGSAREVARNGFNASGLPRYVDGGDLGWSRATCLCPPTNDAVARLSEQFLVVEWKPGGSWQATLNTTRRKQYARFALDELLVEAGRDGSFVNTPVASGFESRNDQWSVDLSAVGKVMLGATTIDVVAGADYARNRARTVGGSRTFEPVIGDPRQIVGTIAWLDRVPLPDAAYEITPGRTAVRQHGQYLTLSVQPIDRTLVQLGLRRTTYKIDAASGSRLVAASGPGGFAGFVPAVTLQYELSDSSRLYASYARSFSAQLLPSSTTIARVRGHAVEVGAKWQVAKAGPLLSVAGYAQPLSGLAFGRPDTSGPTVTCCQTFLRDVASYGVDVEVAGSVRPGWDVQAAYNWNRTRYPSDAAQITGQPQQPTHQARFWLTHTRPDRDGAWQVGGGARLSSRTRTGGTCTLRNHLSGICLGVLVEGLTEPIEQPFYAVGDIRIARRFGTRHEVALNLSNVTDTRYYRTLAGPNYGNYYGEPRAILLTFRTVIE